MINTTKIEIKVSGKKIKSSELNYKELLFDSIIESIPQKMSENDIIRSYKLLKSKNNGLDVVKGVFEIENN